MKPTSRTLSRAIQAVANADIGISQYRLRVDPYWAFDRTCRLLSIHRPLDWTEATLKRFITQVEQ